MTAVLWVCWPIALAAVLWLAWPYVVGFRIARNQARRHCDPSRDRPRRKLRPPLLLVRASTWRRRRRCANHYTAMPDCTGRPLSTEEWQAWTQLRKEASR